MYHFISGYTSKVAGTEAGITDPVPVFSACFGAPFMPLHPTVYAEMLGKKMDEHKVNVWLVNTGWTGGPYGTGTRIKLAQTRSIIDGIHGGILDDAPTAQEPFFGLNVITECPGVPSEILTPRNTWDDPAKYDETAAKLAELAALLGRKDQD